MLEGVRDGDVEVRGYIDKSKFMLVEGEGQCEKVGRRGWRRCEKMARRLSLYDASVA